MASMSTPRKPIRYLRSNSPDSLTGYIHYSNEALYPMWAHLEDAVREGTPRWKQTFGTEGGIFSGFFHRSTTKLEFLKGMHGFGRISSPAVAAAFDLGRFHRLIDLGGRKRSSGRRGARALSPNADRRYSIFPKWPSSTRARSQATSSPTRYRRRISTALDEYLHDWSGQNIHPLLAELHAALPAGEDC